MMYNFNEHDDREVQTIGHNLLEMGVALLGTVALAELGDLSPLPTIGMDIEKETGLSI